MEDSSEKKLDTILSVEAELIPSSGFLASVMERVEAEAAAPRPVLFPWKRAIPGMVVAVGVLGWGGVEGVRYAMQSAPTFPLHQLVESASVNPNVQQAGWVVVACFASLGSWLFARRLAGRSGLL